MTSPCRFTHAIIRLPRRHRRHARSQCGLAPRAKPFAPASAAMAATFFSRPFFLRNIIVRSGGGRQAFGVPHVSDGSWGRCGAPGRSTHTASLLRVGYKPLGAPPYVPSTTMPTKTQPKIANAAPAVASHWACLADRAGFVAPPMGIHAAPTVKSRRLVPPRIWFRNAFRAIATGDCHTMRPR